MLSRHVKHVVVLLSLSFGFSTAVAEQSQLAKGPSIGDLSPTDVQKHLTTALSAAQQFGDKKQQLTADITTAREAYWAAYPKAENLAELEAAYSEKLAVKDMYYLLTRAADRGAAKSSKSLDKQLGKAKALGVTGAADAVDMATGRVDGGMDKASQVFFNTWTDSMFKNLGNLTAAVASPMDVFAPAFGSSSDEYLAYKAHRDFQEHLMNNKQVQADLKLKFDHVVLGSLTDSVEGADKAYAEMTRRLGPAGVETSVNQALESLSNSEKGLSVGSAMAMVTGSPGERMWASMIEQVKAKQGNKQAAALVQTAINDWQFSVKADSGKKEEKGGIGGLIGGTIKNPFDSSDSKEEKKPSRSRSGNSRSKK